MQLHHHWPLRPLAEKIVTRRFFATHEWRGLHFGVFPSFTAARAFCENRGAPCRYEIDHDWWAEVEKVMQLHDYPMLHWLYLALSEQSRVGDLGGSVGVSYYALRPVLPPDRPKEWLVCELPEVCDKGRQLARERGATALAFTTDVADLDDHDIWFSAGAIQFIEQPIDEILSRLRHPPRHLLLNRVPMHDQQGFVTLQNTGLAITPCHVFHTDAFLKKLQAVGFTLRAEWRCSSRSLYVPLHPQHSVRDFRGYYFENREGDCYDRQPSSSRSPNDA